MIENQEQLLHSLNQLEKLRVMQERAANHPERDPRLKKTELAGIRSMISQIEREIRIYNWARIRISLNELEDQSRKLKAEELPSWLALKIRAIQQAADAMQPVL